MPLLTELENLFLFQFYKDFAPTALRQSARFASNCACRCALVGMQGGLCPRPINRGTSNKTGSEKMEASRAGGRSHKRTAENPNVRLCSSRRRGQSARGLAHSRTLARNSMICDNVEQLGACDPSTREQPTSDIEQPTANGCARWETRGEMALLTELGNVFLS